MDPLREANTTYLFKKKVVFHQNKVSPHSSNDTIAKIHIWYYLLTYQNTNKNSLSGNRFGHSEESIAESEHQDIVLFVSKKWKGNYDDK